jgi:hypothetical protein
MGKIARRRANHARGARQFAHPTPIVAYAARLV